MMLLRFLPGAAAAASLVLVPIVLFGPLVLYIIARWRDHRAPVADPQLGLKFAMHLFATTALNVLLLGTAFLIYTLIGPGPASIDSRKAIGQFLAAFRAASHSASERLLLAGWISDPHLRTIRESYQDLVDSVEKADDQTVAASILTVQTRLQASYQTTAMLSQLALVNYLK